MSNPNFDQRRKGTRTRNWATVVYPESAPKNWREILGEMRVPCFLSPLHDKDINPDGTPKKPIIMFFSRSMPSKIANNFLTLSKISAVLERKKSLLYGGMLDTCAIWIIPKNINTTRKQSNA